MPGGPAALCGGRRGQERLVRRRLPSLAPLLPPGPGPQAISELVGSLGYEETHTEVYGVDSQFSAGGGVVVQVRRRAAGPGQGQGGWRPLRTSTP